MDDESHVRSGCGRACDVIVLHPTDGGERSDERLAWEREVALEISVDVRPVPATIHLAGTLDGRTADNLVAVVAELTGDGYRSIELKASALSIPDECGLCKVNRLQRVVAESGGSLVWGRAETD